MESNKTGTPSDSQEHLCYNQIVLLSVLNGIVCATGTVFNGFVVLVIYLDRNLHDTTNIFIASLSISDLISSIIYQPLYIYSISAQTTSEAFEKVRRILGVYSATASIGNLLLITIERFIAVKYPLRYRTILRESRRIKCLVIVWASSFFLSFAAVNAGNAMFVIGGFCLLATLTIVALYTKIFIIAKTQRKKIVIENARFHVRERFIYNRATKTVFLFVGTFLLAWLPLLVFVAVAHKAANFKLSFHWFKTITFTNGFIDPVIYSLRSKKFQNSVGKMIPALFELEEREQHPATTFPMNVQESINIISNPTSI